MTAPQTEIQLTRSSQRVEFGGGSTNSRLLSAGLRATVRPVIDAWARCPQLPWPYGVVDHLGWLLRPIEGARTRQIRLPHGRAVWIDASDEDRDCAILYLHGGAFLTCGLRIHRRLISHVSQAAQAPALCVDYRMMPKNSIDDAVDDCVDGYRYLLEQGYAADRIVVAGDSAGGYLTFAMTARLQELDLPRPVALVAMSPLTDTNPAGKLEHPNSDRCAVFPRSMLAAFADFIEAVDRRCDHLRPSSSTRVAPVDADLSAMPPTLIQVSSTEMLYPDAELMAQRLSDAKVPCMLQVWDGQPHVFQAAAGITPEADQAITALGWFVRTHTPDLGA